MPIQTGRIVLYPVMRGCAISYKVLEIGDKLYYYVNILLVIEILILLAVLVEAKKFWSMWSA